VLGKFCLPSLSIDQIDQNKIGMLLLGMALSRHKHLVL